MWCPVCKRGQSEGGFCQECGGALLEVQPGPKRGEFYLQGTSSLTELQEDAERQGMCLSDDEAQLVQDALYEVTLTLEITEATARIVALDGHALEETARG